MSPGGPPVYEVVAIRYASKRLRLSQLYARFGGRGEEDREQDIAYYFWLLRNGDEVAVVDTGFQPGPGVRRGAELSCEPREALLRLGIDPATVATVILTHLHYDHAGNVGIFENATVLAPAAELEFWSRPAATRPLFAEHVEPDELASIASLRASGRVRAYAGGDALLPGVEAISLPGHSPGLHGLLVQTSSEPVLLSSDAVHLFDELEGDRAFAVLSDLEQMYISFDTVRAIRDEGAVLVPSHDPLVAERFPSLGPDFTDIAFRIA